VRKEKFIYNTQTLRYEKVEETVGNKLFKFLGFLCAVLFFAGIISFLSISLFDSPKEKSLKRELAQMNHQYELMNQRVGTLSNVVDNIQERDRNVYRMIFEVDPMDLAEWEGGIGGSERYRHIIDYPGSGEMIVDATKRVDKLSRQIAMQSKSLDSIVDFARNKEHMLASIPSIKPVNEDKLNRKIRFMSGFGRRMHPIHKVMRMHAGIDFAAPRGTPIVATGDGKVIKVKKLRYGYGLHVVIDHGFGFKTLYAHLQESKVRKGQSIKRGEVLGLLGNTGTSTAPHLHYEVHKNGRKVNPIYYVMDGLTPVEYQALVEKASKSNQSFD